MKMGTDCLVQCGIIVFLLPAASKFKVWTVRDSLWEAQDFRLLGPSKTAFPASYYPYLASHLNPDVSQTYKSYHLFRICSAIAHRQGDQG